MPRISYLLTHHPEVGTGIHRQRTTPGPDRLLRGFGLPRIGPVLGPNWSQFVLDPRHWLALRRNRDRPALQAEAQPVAFDSTPRFESDLETVRSSIIPPDALLPNVIPHCSNGTPPKAPGRGRQPVSLFSYSK